MIRQNIERGYNIYMFVYWNIYHNENVGSARGTYSKKKRWVDEVLGTALPIDPSMWRSEYDEHYAPSKTQLGQSSLDRKPKRHKTSQGGSASWIICACAHEIRLWCSAAGVARLKRIEKVSALPCINCQMREIEMTDIKKSAKFADDPEWEALLKELKEFQDTDPVGFEKLKENLIKGEK